ncbi:MAG: flagellar hook-basal body complex protein FliE [Hyphomicrobiales bacterium]
MTIPASAAANAYAAAAKAVSGAASATPVKATPQDTGFGDALKEAMNSVMQVGQKADQAAMAQATGKADIVDVVTAVAETELAVQTLVSVRDRVISAYQEVMRMPI